MSGFRPNSPETVELACGLGGEIGDVVADAVFDDAGGGRIFLDQPVEQ